MDLSSRGGRLHVHGGLGPEAAPVHRRLRQACEPIRRGEPSGIRVPGARSRVAVSATECRTFSAPGADEDVEGPAAHRSTLTTAFRVNSLPVEAVNPC